MNKSNGPHAICADQCEGDYHCHILVNNEEQCVPLIEDCIEHYEKCLDDCHEECACQNQ